MKVMVIAGGQWQVPLIKYLKEAGHFVINTNLYPDSPGFQYADVGIVADVLDKEKNLDIARQYQPNAVITDQSDIAVPTCAYVAEKLGLPGIGTALATQFTNKYIMRQFCHENGFPSPKFYQSSSASDALDLGQQLGFPLVVKPVDNQSSRGVIKVTELESLHTAVEQALSNSRSHTILLEEFIDGIELTVDGLKFSDRHVSLAISSKSHYKHNPMVAKSLLFTSHHPDIDFAALKTLNNQLVEQSGLPFGLTHAEYKYSNGKFYLIEIAARGGGTKLSSDLVPFLSQVDNYSYYVDLALGKTCFQPRDLPPMRSVVAALDFLSFPSGVVKKISGVEQARALEGILDLDIAIKEGDRLTPPQEDRSRHGYVIAYASSTAQLAKTLADVRSLISIDYIP